MTTGRPQRRMTLRQLLTHSEKCVRDLAEHLSAVVLPHAQDFRDLSRPVPRRSHYPTLLAMHNALKKLHGHGAEAQELAEYLLGLLQEIREHAGRERVARR